MTVNVNAKTWVIGTDIAVSGGRGYSDATKVPSGGGGGTPVWSQDFETDMSGFTPFHSPSSVARVTSNPDTGTYALRGNVKHGVTDTITGLTSPDGRTVDCTPPSLRSLTPNICVHRYRFNMDDATWLTSTGSAAEVKMGYWSDTSASDSTQDAFWPVINTGTGRIAYIGRNSTWLNGTLTSWPAPNVYFQDHGTDVGPGTGYHTFELHFDYDNDIFRMYIDGTKILGSSYFTDGEFQLGNTFHLDSWRVFYSGNTLSMSTDGTGYACGWQVDNVKFYDEVPP